MRTYNMIPVYQPLITQKSKDFVNDAMSTGWVSGGKYIDLCESFLSQMFDVHCLLTSSGTSALHLCALALSEFHSDVDELDCPDNVYVAAWNAFQNTPFYELVPIKTDINTWNAELRPKSRARLVVHNLGCVVNTTNCNGVTIEDNCEGLFGRYNDRYTGTRSFASAASFFGNKTITCGEGGVFMTPHKDVLDYIKDVYSQGCNGRNYTAGMMGYNYRMTNLQAAFLYGQLVDIDSILAAKKRVFNQYDDLLGNSPVVGLRPQAEHCENANWIYPIRVANAAKTRELLRSCGIDSRPMFPPINHHKQYNHIEGKFRNATVLHNEVMLLPSYPDLTECQIDYISQQVLYYQGSQDV